MDARDWLHRSIRYNKPLIWWSIWSRTSSSIIHSSPLVTSATQRLPGSQTAWAPRCTCVTQRLCIHQPVYLRPVAPRTRDSSPKVVTIRPRRAEVVCFYLTFKARDKAASALVFWAGSISATPLLFFSLWLFLGSLLLLPTCALYQPPCYSIQMPAFCPIIFFTNYGNLVSLIQLCTPRNVFDGNTFGTTGNWDPVFAQGYRGA